MRLDIIPMGAPRMTQSDKWNRRPVIVRYFDYKDKINEALPHYQLPIVLKLDFYIPFPKSYSKKKRAALLGKYHDQKPDSDNLAKGFMDAFRKDEEGNKTDDKHVADLHVRKFWAEKGAIEIHE